MKYFWKAISDKLVADSTLTTLLGYNSTSKINITRSDSQTAPYKTGLFFEENYTIKTGGSDTNKLRETDLYFFLCHSGTQVDCADVVRQIESLFENANESKAFLDFSNAQVYCRWSEIDEVGKIVRNDELDKWECRMIVTVKWSYK